MAKKDATQIKSVKGGGKSASAMNFKPEDDFDDDQPALADIIAAQQPTVTPKKRGRKSKAELAAAAGAAIAQRAAVVTSVEEIGEIGETEPVTPVDDTEGWPEPETISDQEFADAEEAIAARVDSDALAAEPAPDELDQLVQEVIAEEQEVDALMNAVEEQPGLTAQQREEVTKLQATTLVFELYIKRTGFKRSVPADAIIKSDLDGEDTQVPQVNPEQAINEALADANLSEAEKAAQRRKLIKVRKRILDCPELDAIDQTARDFKSWLQNRRVPCSILRGGRFVIPVAYVAEVENRFQEFKALRRARVKAFLLVYDQRITEAETAYTEAGMSTLFRRADFPAKEELARAYQVQREWRAFDAPKALQTIKATMWADAQAQIQVQLAGVADEAKDALRETFADYINWTVDRLTQEEGQTKRKAINENKVGQMIEFLKSVDNLNIGGDEELRRLSEQARNVITGIDLKALKKDDGVRETIRQSFAQLKEATASWIVEKDRVVCFNEEDV